MSQQFITHKSRLRCASMRSQIIIRNKLVENKGENWELMKRKKNSNLRREKKMCKCKISRNKRERISPMIRKTHSQDENYYK